MCIRVFERTSMPAVLRSTETVINVDKRHLDVRVLEWGVRQAYRWSYG